MKSLNMFQGKGACPNGHFIEHRMRHVAGIKRASRTDEQRPIFNFAMKREWTTGLQFPIDIDAARVFTPRPTGHHVMPISWPPR